jgi:hypothetical protein
MHVGAIILSGKCGGSMWEILCINGIVVDNFYMLENWEGNGAREL